MKKALILSAALLTAAGATAEIKLPAVLGSNMVLQQQTHANLWGKATPNKTVHITTSWNHRNYAVRAAQDSTWKVAVETPAAGGPYSIRLSDGTPLTLDNILIGEVWICSGQSNMQTPVMGNPGQPVEHSTETILDAPQQKGIRLFTVKRVPSATPLDDCQTDGGWQMATPASVANFSAVGYFFGKNLHQTLDVPIGLIESDWGGTRIETWITMEAAQKVESNQTETDAKFDEYNKTQRLYNGMILPIASYTAQGFIWYQGESQIFSGNQQFYAQYMEQFVPLWREVWGKADMPFYYVQIAPYIYFNPDDTQVPLIVEQQIMALDRIPNVGMASTTDIGDLNCIHPPHKAEVGQRLALLALSKTYGLKGLMAEAPRYRSVRFEGGKAIVTLTTDGWLGPNYVPSIGGFEIAGSDKVFVPAQATINGTTEVIVSAEGVTNPVAVRYAFRNVPKAAGLYNTGHVAAFPFRTDTWNDVR